MLVFSQARELSWFCFFVHCWEFLWEWKDSCKKSWTQRCTLSSALSTTFFHSLLVSWRWEPRSVSEDYVHVNSFAEWWRCRICVDRVSVRRLCSKVRSHVGIISKTLTRAAYEIHQQIVQKMWTGLSFSGRHLIWVIPPLAPETWQKWTSIPGYHNGNRYWTVNWGLIFVFCTEEFVCSG